jgi:hypothetical protein
MSEEDKLHIEVGLKAVEQRFQQRVKIFYQGLPDPAPMAGKLYRTNIHAGRKILLPGMKDLAVPAGIRQAEQPEGSMPVGPERGYP